MWTEGVWVAIISGAAGLMGAIATGIAAGLVRVVNLLLTQSQDTIKSLQHDRDYWREKALGRTTRKDGSQ